MKKLLALLLVVLMIISISACASTDEPAPPEDVVEVVETVVIKFFSNQADRSSNQGKIEDMLIAQYEAENPNVKIEVEALQDEPYKVSFSAYATSGDMPDFFNVWGQPGFLYDYIDAGLIQELNQADYAGYGFVPGCLDGFSKDGKLYGLPRNTDLGCIFYNKAIFAENGWEVPATYEDLVDLAKAMNAAGIMPMTTNGGDGWPLCIFLTDLLAKCNGGFGDQTQAAIDKADFSDPAFAEASKYLQDAALAGLFTKSYASDDYGAAKNLFVNGQAAMYYIGGWEMGMASDDSITAMDPGKDIGVFVLPAPKDAKGKTSDISAWFGGGYAVASNSPVKEEALKLLNWWMRPENWTRLCTEEGITLTAQDGSSFKGKTAVQSELAAILGSATSTSGTTINDCGSSEFKTISESAIVELVLGKLTPEEFCDKLAGK